MDSMYYNSGEYSDFLVVFLQYALIFGLILFIFSFILYIFYSLGLMKIAQKKGIENAWLAWIPFGNAYILGKVVGPFKFIVDISKPELVLMILPLLTFVPILGSLAGIASMILMYAAYYYVYKEYRGEKANLKIILSIIFPFLIPFFIYGIGKDNVLPKQETE